jgi:UDP-3-O-[3-hydroxymyristoyl] glucosamine N-acyltransferase
MINVFGKDKWSLKVTALLEEGEYKSYDKTDYDQAPGDLPWVIAKESAEDRKTISETLLSGCTFANLYAKICDDDSTIFGEGSILGFASIIRPGSTVGNFTYIGASTVIDIDCTIGDYVTIGDNVTIGEGATVADGITIPSNTYVEPGSTLN